MSGASVATLQSVVLRAVDSAPGCIDGHVLRLNPHFWRTEDMRSVYNDRDMYAQLPWGSEWPVVKAIASLHPRLSADDVCLAFHGTKDTNLVKHILHEGYEPKYNKHGGSGFKSPDGAYFGINAEVAQKYGKVLLFVIPKTACGGVRGDGAFHAPASSTLSVGAYQLPSNYGFGNLFLWRVSPENQGVAKSCVLLCQGPIADSLATPVGQGVRCCYRATS